MIIRITALRAVAVRLPPHRLTAQSIAHYDRVFHGLKDSVEILGGPGRDLPTDHEIAPHFGS